MARLQPNAFSSYELEESEILGGQVLNLSQKIIVQNKLSIVAHQLIGLKFTSQDPIEFAQQQAYWLGKKDQLEELLQDSSDAEAAIIAAKTQSAVQP